MSLAIGLPLRNQQALANLLREIYNPDSPLFRHFLTPEQFTEQFGPSLEDYQAVAAFALAHGFRVTQTHSNRVVLDVNGTVGDIETAFHINLQVYQHPSEPRVFYAPNTDPWVDDASVPILDITGLDNYKLPHPLLHEIPLPLDVNAAQPAFGSGPGGTYRGNDFRAAYAPGVAANGLGQTVGLLEFDGYYANDITSYESQAGLPNVPLSNVLLDSFNGTPGGANIEVALDIEVAIAMAPGLSQIIVYEAGPSGFPNDILSRMVSDNLAKQISSSWTWSGGPNGTTEQLFQQMAAQGQSFFQASGDSDAYPGSIPQPAESPNVTVVGGTILSTSGPGGNWTSETTWNWFNSGSGTNGSSGGISGNYLIPAWQQGINMSANQGSTTMRNIPDVALTADNIWVTYNNGGSGGVAGTSCAAPLWAAFMALINQQALVNGSPTVGFLNPALYGIGTGTGYSNGFHDITSGNNTNKSSPNKFFAVPGYDLCTGWGTPTGSNLINALAGPAVARIASNSLALVVEGCSNNAVDPDETVTINFGLINIGSASTANLVATLQTGGGVVSPGPAQSYGVLTVGGPTVVRPFTFTANGACGGLLTATLQLQDGASNLGSVTFTIRLGATVPVTAFVEDFDGIAAPALPNGWTSKVTSGLTANWISTNGVSDTAPNSAFAPDASTASQTELISPLIPILSDSAQLSFRHNYNLAMRAGGHPRTTNYYDGGVLQVSIAGGPFTELTAAGGSFAAGGYNCSLATGTGNPLAGAQAWGGSSTGWVSSAAYLPAAAAGQNIQLKWVLGTGVNSSVAVGWFIDSISVLDHWFDCCSPNADVAVRQAAAPAPAVVGQNLVYTLTITNGGPAAAAAVTVTDSLPSSVTFVSASPGCVNLGGTIACTIGTLNAGRASNIVVTVTPTAEATLTNSVTVTTSTTDPGLVNNTSTATSAAYIAPGIIAGPTNQVANVGGSASFSVSATGSAPLSYQWIFQGAALGGETAPTLTLSNVQGNQAGNYAVIVANLSGSITSTVATLTVLVPPSIVAQPTNQTVVLGQTANFQVGANGSAPLSYQWTFSGASITGATTSALSLGNVQTNQAGGYALVITNNAGSITSSVAVLTVLVPPAITLQPVGQSVIVGSNVTFQAAASGSIPLSYQWFFNSAALAGATSTTLGLTNVQANQGGNYSLRVTNNAGAATSVLAQLTVLVPPSISSQPTNQVVLAGASARFQVSASGSAPLDYQWWFNGTNLVGNGSNSLALANVQAAQAGAYNVVITNSVGAITSILATLTVGTPPAITQQPTDAIVVQGQSATFSVGSSGDVPLNFQWRFNGSNLGGATDSSLSLSGASPANAGSYDAVASNAYGSVTSIVAQLTVLVPPTITAQPTNQAILAGGIANFQVTATGTGPLAYQWWFNGTNTVGSNTNVLTLGNLQLNQAGNYTVSVTNLAGSATSSAAILVVATPPSITQQPASLVITQNQNATFTVGGTGDAPLNYQWRLNAVPLASGSSSSYSVIGATPANAGAYDAIVSNAYGSVTSLLAQLTVLVPPAITSQPTNQTVGPGATATFQVIASGTSPLGYQWWFNATNAVGTNANTLTLTSAQPAQAGQYCVVVTNSAGSVTSVMANLTIAMAPQINQQPFSLTVIEGQDARFAVGAVGTGALLYQWRFNGSPLAAATDSSFTVTAANPGNAGAYDAVVSSTFGSVTSLLAQLIVLVPPAIAVQPTNQTVAIGTNASLVAAATGTAPLTYQWTLNGKEVPGATSNLLTLTNVQAGQAGTYALLVTNSAGSASSASAYLKILVPPTASNLTAQGNAVSLHVATIPGLSYLLEYKRTLQDPTWTPTTPWTPGTGGDLLLQDTNAPDAFRFYRIRSQ